MATSTNSTFKPALILEALKESALTQGDIASLVGVTPEYVRQIGLRHGIGLVERSKRITAQNKVAFLEMSLTKAKAELETLTKELL